MRKVHHFLESILTISHVLHVMLATPYLLLAPACLVLPTAESALANIRINAYNVLMGSTSEVSLPVLLVLPIARHVQHSDALYVFLAIK